MADADLVLVYLFEVAPQCHVDLLRLTTIPLRCFWPTVFGEDAQPVLPRNVLDDSPFMQTPRSAHRVMEDALAPLALLSHWHMA